MTSWPLLSERRRRHPEGEGRHHRRDRTGASPRPPGHAEQMARSGRGRGHPAPGPPLGQAAIPAGDSIEHVFEQFDSTRRGGGVNGSRTSLWTIAGTPEETAPNGPSRLSAPPPPQPSGG